MAKRRTKSQKKAAKHTYSYIFNEADTAEVHQSVAQPSRTTQRHHMANEGGVALITETRFVVGDMLRTSMFSLLILAIELGIYWYWRG